MLDCDFSLRTLLFEYGWNRGSARVALRTLVLISKKRTLVLKLPNSNSKLARMCLLFLLSFHS